MGNGHKAERSSWICGKIWVRPQGEVSKKKRKIEPRRKIELGERSLGTGRHLYHISLKSQNFQLQEIVDSPYYGIVQDLYIRGRYYYQLTILLPGIGWPVMLL